MFRAFWNAGYAPPGWQPGWIWTHVVADAAIAIACSAIAVALAILIRRRRNLAFAWVFRCFAVFIFVTGLTHAMTIWTLWQGVYGLEALVKLVAALITVAAAVMLWLLLPKAIALPSANRLQSANTELAAIVAERDSALEELRAEIDHRERAEAALLQSQKLEAVGQLTGGIAHDFNNLLQAIAGSLELISRRPDHESNVVRWAAAALDAVERGRSLSGQLLAFSRRQKLDIAPVRLAELIQGMRELIERAVAPLSTVKIGRIDPIWKVEADPLQLELAILNLAFNARDAMPEGGTLTITAERRSGEVAPDLPEGDYVALSLSDTGRGMPPEVAARAAEPFFTTKGVGEGTGMGLSMAFGVLAQSRGALTIESEEGKGTTITLFLRLTTLEPRRELVDDAAGDARVRLDGKSIVLADDDAQVRVSLAEMLRLAGAEVREATSGAEGLALVETRRPDLMIVDFAMPGMSGAEVARKARTLARGMPVLLVTGFADSATLDALDIVVLKKPFESRELLRRAAEMLD